MFGEAVHRICELRPPRARWDAVIEDTLVAMEYDHDITATDREAVCDHAQRAIEYVESEMAPETMRYDEFEATADLPGGRLHGFIDCLLVDGSDYHIIDYKTGDHDPGDLDAKTAYYQPQLDAYAAMLAATATVDTVTTTLYYTAPEAAQSTVYDKDPTPSKILESIDERIQALRSGISR